MCLTQSVEKLKFLSEDQCCGMCRNAADEEKIVIPKGAPSSLFANMFWRQARERIHGLRGNCGQMAREAHGSEWETGW